MVMGSSQTSNLVATTMVARLQGVITCSRMVTGVIMSSVAHGHMATVANMLTITCGHTATGTY